MLEIAVLIVVGGLALWAVVAFANKRDRNAANAEGLTDLDSSAHGDSGHGTSASDPADCDSSGSADGGCDVGGDAGGDGGGGD